MQTTVQYIKKELADLYPDSEIQSFTRILIETYCGWNYTQQVLNQKKTINKSAFNSIGKAVSRLKKFEPIQYILGETEFMGLKLKLNSSVLIPRPETEELVSWMLEKGIRGKVKILDIGTGSGCIPISLKKELELSTITGIDLSEKALEIASQNALQYKLDVQLFQADILNWENYAWGNYDVIVSNPPYVRESEKKEMMPNVLRYEPANALYVSDRDPLLFYRRIAEFAQKHLKEEGKLFFEINEFLATETCNLLKDNNFYATEVKNDIFGKSRMIYCQKKNRGSV